MATPAEVPSRPISRVIGEKLQELMNNMTTQMLRDGYSSDDITALAALVNATAAHTSAGLSVREFIDGRKGGKANV